MTQLKTEIAMKLKEARKKSNLTQKQVAVDMGVTIRTIQFFESGEINITVDTIGRYCKAVNAIPKFSLEIKHNTTA